jgi:hypothetical protein
MSKSANSSDSNINLVFISIILRNTSKVQRRLEVKTFDFEITLLPLTAIRFLVHVIVKKKIELNFGFSKFLKT